MIAIRVRLLHGWTRAAGSNAAITGSPSEADGEWPLSPARLFSALVAGGGTGPNRRIAGDDAELRALESADPPLIMASAPADLARTVLHERFVVLDSTAKGVVHNYPGRTSTVARPGVRVHPRNPELVYVWPSLELSSAERELLVRRAARVGYLGSADAPVHVEVLADVPSIEGAWVPTEGGIHSVAVPYPGFLSALDATFEQFLSGGTPLGVNVPRRRVTYGAPGERSIESAPTPLTVWAQFDRPVAGRKVVAVAEAVKGLVLSSFENRGGDNSAPDILTGHGLPAGAPHARFLPLPNVGEFGDGRLFGVLILLPPDTEGSILQRVRRAVDGGTIRLAGGTQRSISLAVSEEGRVTVRPSTWTRAARTWVSATPIVFERFGRSGPSAKDVASMFANVGLPAPQSFRFARVPLLGGAIDLRPHETVRSGRPVRPYAHGEFSFREPVPGPVAVGQMRSFGLGLLAPRRTGFVGLEPESSGGGAHLEAETA